MIKKSKLKIWILLFLFCFSNIVSATVVADNDGSAFITKAEFDSLKNNFQSQLDQYNSGIDNKIDSAISSYLAGINISAEGQYDNVYENWKCGTNFVWGNNKGVRESTILGGSYVYLDVCDIRVRKRTTIKYKNDLSYNIFLSTEDDHLVYLAPYKYTLIYNDNTMFSFAQEATTTNWNMSTAAAKPELVTQAKRNGTISDVYDYSYQWPQLFTWTCFVAERWEASTSPSVLSINRTSNEYYIRDTGDEETTITAFTTNSGGEYYRSGDFAVNSTQTYTKTVTPGWGKSYQHNYLGIYEWKKLTDHWECIEGGAPTAFVRDDDVSVTIELDTDCAGTIYAYSSKTPTSFTSDDDFAFIGHVDGPVTKGSCTIKKCKKDDIIRTMFLPDTGTGVLNIRTIKYKKVH